MKALGKAAIVLTIIFFALLIPGAILTAKGASQAVHDAQDSGVFETVEGYFEQFAHEIGDSTFYGMDLDNADITQNVVIPQECSSIVLHDTCYNIKVNVGTGDAMILHYVGKYPAYLSSRFDLDAQGVYYDDGTGAIPASGSDIAAGGISGSDIGDKPFDVDILGGKLEVTLDGMSHSAIKNIGKSTLFITLPRSYKGGFEIIDGVGEMDIEGVDLAAISLRNAVGELDIDDSRLGMLSIHDITGEIGCSGAIDGIDISDAIGRVDIDLDMPLKNSTSITNVIGEVKLEVPRNSKIRLVAEDNAGKVKCDEAIRSDSGVEVSVFDNIGEFRIKADD